MALFQRPKVDQKEYLKNLEKEIFSLTEDLEKTKVRYSTLDRELEREYSLKKAAKEKELAELENKVMFLRSERIELEKPIDHKRIQLDEREKELEKREAQLRTDEQRAFEREREAEKKLESVQELADELGETRVRHMVKEKLLTSREIALQDKEALYLVKIEKFSKEVNESSALIQERENELTLKQLNLEGKEENLVRREKELLEGHILLNDRNILVEKAWKELREREQKLTNHGTSSQRRK